MNGVHSNIPAGADAPQGAIAGMPRARDVIGAEERAAHVAVTTHQASASGARLMP